MPPSLVYVERMIGTSSMKACSECHKLIRWPEEVRLYARDMKAVPIYYDHVEHPIRAGAVRAG